MNRSSHSIPRQPGADWIRTLREALRLRRTQIGLGISSAILLLGVIGPFIAPYSPTVFVGAPFAAPSRAFPLGTDYLGRDVLSRLLSGGDTILGVALLATLVGVGAGTAIGLATGYSKTWRGQVAMQIVNIALAFPQIILVLLFLALVGPELWLVVLLVGVGHTPRVSRVMQAAAIGVSERDFVRAAAAVGMPKWRILLSEVLPNVTGPLMVEFGLRFAYSIAIVSALSFLGFGQPPPSPDWGLMIYENQFGITVHALPVVAPVIAIALATIGANLVADGLARATGRIDFSLGQR